ncbi:MAG: hypothetical protein ABJB66_07605 [Gemmatimonadaceae bacterium]
MTRKSRLFVLIVAAALPMIAACSSSDVTGPNTGRVLRDGSGDSIVVDTTKRHDSHPWG